MTRLNVVVDVGSSQTRVLWNVDDGSIVFRYFSSDCSLPSTAQTAEVMGSTSFLVETPKVSFVVGQMAANSPLAESALEGLKIEPAGPKVMAALHVALQHTELADPVISLMLMLPYKERDSFRVLEAALKKHFSRGFLCNGIQYQPNVERIECLSEGAGLIRYFTDLDPELQSEQLLTAMIGYRDFSLIYSCGRESAFTGRTARMGFLWVIKDMEDQVGQLDRLKTAELLYRLGAGPMRKEHFLPLARTHSSDLKSAELSELAKAARASRRKYKEFVSSLLSGYPISDYRAVLLGGGTGDYLESYLKDLLGDKLITPEPLVAEMQRDYEFERSQAVRLADVYAAALMQSKLALEAVV